jgi:hypothetical protein
MSARLPAIGFPNPSKMEPEEVACSVVLRGGAFAGVASRWVFQMLQLKRQCAFGVPLEVSFILVWIYAPSVLYCMRLFLG